MAKKKIINTVEISEMPYYSEAKVSCSCGAKFFVGSTKKEIQVEVCSQCHPFYTGTQKFIDSSGRLEKFKARIAKHEEFMKKSLKSDAKVKKDQPAKNKSDIKNKGEK